MQKYMKINVGKTVPEQLKLDHDLEVEYQAVPRLNKGIEVARAKGDNGTRALLERILATRRSTSTGSRRSSSMIKEIGAENYLAQQIEG